VLCVVSVVVVGRLERAGYPGKERDLAWQPRRKVNAAWCFHPLPRTYLHCRHDLEMRTPDETSQWSFERIHKATAVV